MAPIDWRWEYWIALIIAAVSWIPLWFLPGKWVTDAVFAVRLTYTETYGPVLEVWRVRAARERGNSSESATLPAPEKQGAMEILKAALIRPMRLFAEPIVLATSSLMALEYAIFYLFFEAYPIIFEGRVSCSPSVSPIVHTNVN